MSGSTTVTHGDASPLELVPDRAPMKAQLGTNLAEGPTLGVQVGRTVNVHRDTVTSRALYIGQRPAIPSTRRASPAWRTGTITRVKPAC